MADRRAEEARAVTVSREQERTASAEELWSTYEGLRAEYEALQAETDRLGSVYLGLSSGPESEAAWSAYAEMARQEKACWDQMHAVSTAWHRVWDTGTPDE
jgi:hypothetical protein